MVVGKCKVCNVPTRELSVKLSSAIIVEIDVFDDAYHNLYKQFILCIHLATGNNNKNITIFVSKRFARKRRHVYEWKSIMHT